MIEEKTYSVEVTASLMPAARGQWYWEVSACHRCLENDYCDTEAEAREALAGYLKMLGATRPTPPDDKRGGER